MAFLKRVLITIMVLMVVVLGIGFMLPAEFKVERQIDIDASPAQVYNHIADLRQWRNWGVWYQRDLAMQVSYQGAESGPGMKALWQSKQEGNGEMTVIAADQNKRLVYTLYFADFDMGSTGEMKLIENDGKTTVLWQDYGDVGNNPLNHYFVLMMDDFVGPDFETSLLNLKTLVESE
ncbi:SRPBCC family protein [Neptunicella sp. SCSIO 80796]|uniref:SRPBCC family protein n=1 Tax=Neptunicella plasticusilytica TaxID=3117012 RepID=UPI003A4D87AC